MDSGTEIRFVHHREIDKDKWDRCISSASNERIYGYTLYLDTMSEHWDALVMNDYECVMPLPWNKKVGISYLYQPFQCAQLGVFGNHISPDSVIRFLEKIPARFRYTDIYLNAGNLAETQLKGYYTRKNYTLSLHHSYPDLSASYRENTRRNIQKAAPHLFSFTRDFAVEKLIEAAVPQMRAYGPIHESDIRKFRNLYGSLHQTGQAMTYGITDRENKLLSGCIFFFSGNRAYYILAASSEEGKQKGASHTLINEFIKEQAGKDIILDFEGSDVDSLAFFYSGFGASEEPYACYRNNRLPWFIRWMKP